MADQSSESDAGRSGQVVTPGAGVAGTLLLSSWIVFLTAILFNAYDAFLRVTPSVTTEQLHEALQVDAQGLGHMMTFYFVPYVLLQIPVGLMVDRMGPRKLLVGATLLSSVGSFVFATAGSRLQAYAARFLMGVGGAFPGVGPIYLASRWFPRRYIGTLAGLTGTATVVGSIGGEAVLGTWLEHGLTWRQGSLIATGVGLVIALLIWLFVRNRPEVGHPLHEPETAAPRATLADAKTPVLRVLASRQNWLNSVWGGLTLMPMLAFAALWAVPFLSRLYDVTSAVAATAVSAIFLGQAFGGPVAGLVSDSLHSRRWPMAIFTFIALLDTLVILYVPGVPFAAMYPLLALLGFCLGSQGSLVFAVALEINDRSASGVAIGFTQGMSNLGGAVFPPLIGWLLTLFADPVAAGAEMTYDVGAFRLALAVIPLGLAVAVVVALCLKESYGADAEIPADETDEAKGS